MLARKARLVNELTCNLELSHTVSDTRASIEFQHTPFSEDDLYTIQSFYANRKLGDRTNEDTAQVAAILSNVLEALGVFDPLAQAVLVNHCSYCQYRREELIAVADSPATAFGLVLQGQCQAIEAGVQAGHPATLMRRRVLCPGACHRAGEEEQTLGPTLPPGSFFGIELCEAAPREILLWERSVMAIGACDVLSIEQGQLQALYKPPLLDIARRSKLLSKFPLFENETEHTMSALATSLVKTKVASPFHAETHTRPLHVTVRIVLGGEESGVAETRLTVQSSAVYQRKDTDPRAPRGVCGAGRSKAAPSGGARLTQSPMHAQPALRECRGPEGVCIHRARVYAWHRIHVRSIHVDAEHLDSGHEGSEG
eukprot:TRINITY_DN6420_c0_g1_i2.p1 TRINITY_DN6420_c0_g1~~TRINITY_DN6420_c0_g1_i2.p1  ORF type:complete len:369 (+),score=47.39 TRINITY_DN6420_c0_g1_i2:236-1342(+)